MKWIIAFAIGYFIAVLLEWLYWRYSARKVITTAEQIARESAE